MKSSLQQTIFILLFVLGSQSAYPGNDSPASFTTVTANKEFASDLIHAGFNEVLKKYVIDGRVNYSGIRDDQDFYAYLDILKETKPDKFSTTEEKLAFWINAYNALAIKGILDGLSPSSFFRRVNYFKLQKYEVGERAINLDDLEKKVIIPFGEPRIHFAIVCASASCPLLRSEAYLAATLDQQLDENTKVFINNPDKNNFDLETKTAWISKIFDWFDTDFKQHAGSVRDYIAQYIDDKKIAEFLVNKDFRLKYLGYDWSLNGTLD